MKKVAVHQMGKVASSAIFSALSQTPRVNVLQTHLLSRESVEASSTAYVAAGRREHPDHIRASQRLMEWVEDCSDDLYIITLVRDPFARNISAFLQNINYFGLRGLSRKRERYIYSAWIRFVQRGKGIDSLVTDFIDRYPHEAPLDWFDKELRDPTGVDVYQTHFDPRIGHCVINKGRYHILVLRYESSSKRKRSLISDFIQEPVPHLARANVTAEKGHMAFLYSMMKSRTVFSATLADRVLSSQYCQHFFSDAERDQMWARWVEGA